MIVFDPYTRKPKWAGRYQKPNFKYLGSGGVTIPASETSPIYLVIGGQEYRRTTNLDCSMVSSGLGGLDKGSIASSTIYYLYVVSDGGTLYTLASKLAPTEGPQTALPWTYIGAFPSSSTSTVIKFRSVGGFLVSYGTGSLEDESITGTTAVTAKTYSMLPVNAHMAYGIGYLTGTVVNSAGRVASDTNAATSFILLILQVSGIIVTINGFVPIETPNTIYLKVDNTSNTMNFGTLGWIEDPSEYA